MIGRTYHRAPNLKFYVRITLGWLSLLISPKRLASVAIIIQPATLLKFHRALVKRKYQRLFGRRGRKRPDPKGPSKELIAAIVELKQRKPRYGCPRIAEVVTLTFGIPINKDIVRRILARHYKPVHGKTDRPTWLTLIGHNRDSLWSRGAGPFDLFRCESLTVQSYWVLVIMDQWSRRIIGFGIHRGNVDGISLCRMFNQASSGTDPPRYLSSDNDPLFRFHRWRANMRILEVEEIKTVPFTPISHPFVERLIGTIRREYLDHTPFWNSLDLQRKLDQFKDYYNQYRTHSALNGSTPLSHYSSEIIDTVDIRNYQWRSHCNALFQTPITA